MNNNSFSAKNIWRLIYPLLIYEGVVLVASFVAAFIITFITMVTGTLTFEELYTSVLNQQMQYLLEIQTIATVITLPILLLLMRMDNKKMARTAALKVYKKTPLWQYLFVIVLGMAACYLGNFFINISGIYKNSQAIETVQEVLYQGKILLEFISVGILTPILEEILFRGIIYRRMKEMMPLKAAAILATLFFAVYHGNLPQGIYAACIGLLMIYVYERYKSLLAPILFHIAANCLSLAFSELNFLKPVIDTQLGMYATAFISGLLILLMIWFIEQQVQPAILSESKVDTDGEQTHKET